MPSPVNGALRVHLYVPLTFLQTAKLGQLLGHSAPADKEQSEAVVAQ